MVDYRSLSNLKRVTPYLTVRKAIIDIQLTTGARREAAVGVACAIFAPDIAISLLQTLHQSLETGAPHSSCPTAQRRMSIRLALRLRSQLGHAELALAHVHRRR